MFRGQGFRALHFKPGYHSSEEGGRLHSPAGFKTS